MRHSPSSLVGLLLSVWLSAAVAGNATGTWEYQGPAKSGMWLKTRQVGHRVRFQMEIARGEPSFNSGWIEGQFELNGTSGVFETNEHGHCEIKFQFAHSSVHVMESEEKQECGFGYNVYATGTLNLKNRKKPKFSVTDPRHGSQ